MGSHLEHIFSYITDYMAGKMWKSTMEKNIEIELEAIKAEALEEAYNDGTAVPNDMNCLLDAIGDNH